MLKSLSTLEHKIGEKLFHFHCAPDSTLGELHDALCAMKGFIVSRIMSVHEAEEKKRSAPVEAPKEEVGKE